MTARVKKDHRHLRAPSDIDLPHTIHDDLHRLSEVEVPVVTVSATYRRDIAKHLGERAKNLEDAVFSRAHFSMAVAVFEQATRQGLSCWLVDPTNYVAPGRWKGVIFTEAIGQRVARNPVLKKLKDFVETFARGKLPIASAITEPLIYVVSQTKRPIISLHYETGNILARAGKKVLQVVTDPHVRIQYLLEAERANITFAVFDEKTRKEFLTKANAMGKHVDAERVVVTGPPVDPRIVEAREGKRPDNFTKRALRLAITTGGLGTNKGEIEKILEQIAIRVKSGEINLILYAGTHTDFKKLYERILAKHKIEEGDQNDIDARARIIFDQSIIRVNQKLIKTAFPWADGFITKPSGDMAYDAVAAGCFLLTLSPWGEWEENVQEIFESAGIAKRAQPRRFSSQLDELLRLDWPSSAMESAARIDPLFLQGAKKIVDLQLEYSLE